MALRILVVTSCSGSKAFSLPNGLTLADFQAGQAHLAKRTGELAAFSLPAAQMYTGRQHHLILDACQNLRDHHFPHEVSVVIVSAGYGLLDPDDVIVPYAITFASKELAGKKGKRWAHSQQLTPELQRAVDQHDLILVLLGADYLSAIDFPLDTRSGQTLVFLATQKKCDVLRGHKARVGCVGLSNGHARQFHCGLISLRGQLFQRLANGWLAEPASPQRWFEQPQQALDAFMRQGEAG